MKLFLLIVGCVLGVTESVLIEWTASDYPNPQEDPEACGRTEASYVCDPNRLISKKAADFLDHILLNLQNDTKCPCSSFSCENREHSKGYIMAIALVRKIYLPENVQDTVDSRKSLVNQFAYDLLHKRWNNWDTCDEVIIIVFSQDDGILTTVSGNTPLRVLTDPITKAIQLELARFFRSDGNVGQGLHYLTMNYRRVLDGYHYYPIMYSDVPADSAATMIKVSILTSLITTFLLKLFC